MHEPRRTPVATHRTARSNRAMDAVEDAFYGMPGREAYLSLADEFDPMGATTVPTLADFDPTVVEAARGYATANALPLPWEVRSMDNALAYVQQAERAL